MKNLVVVLAAVLFMTAGSLATAATGDIRSPVRTLLIDSENFGGCLFQLAELPAGLDCASNWVSASCSGDYNASNMGWRKFETAQLAHAMNKDILVRVDDSRRHNGQCFALRVQLLP